MASTRVVLPWSTCAINAMLRKEGWGIARDGNRPEVQGKPGRHISRCGTVSGERQGGLVAKFLKLALILLVAVGIGVGVARLNEMKQKFLAMSEEEQRALIAEKVGDRVSAEKLEEIQNKVIAAVSGK
jgi:hypothetical protein